MAVRVRAANGIELAADVAGPWHGPLGVLRGRGESDWAPDGVLVDVTPRIDPGGRS